MRQGRRGQGDVRWKNNEKRTETRRCCWHSSVISSALGLSRSAQRLSCRSRFLRRTASSHFFSRLLFCYYRYCCCCVCCCCCFVVVVMIIIIILLLVLSFFVIVIIIIVVVAVDITIIMIIIVISIIINIITVIIITFSLIFWHDSNRGSNHVKTFQSSSFCGLWIISEVLICKYTVSIAYARRRYSELINTHKYVKQITEYVELLCRLRSDILVKVLYLYFVTDTTSIQS